MPLSIINLDQHFSVVDQLEITTSVSQISPLSFSTSHKSSQCQFQPQSRFRQHRVNNSFSSRAQKVYLAHLSSISPNFFFVLPAIKVINPTIVSRIQSHSILHDDGRDMCNAARCLKCLYAEIMPAASN